MSRSFKKFPQYRDNLWGRSLKDGKRYNNRKIRRKLKNIEIQVNKGKGYRRYGIDSWDLWEFKSYQTKQDAINDWTKDQIEIKYGISPWKAYHKITKEEAIKYWYKTYRRK